MRLPLTCLAIVAASGGCTRRPAPAAPLSQKTPVAQVTPATEVRLARDNEFPAPRPDRVRYIGMGDGTQPVPVPGPSLEHCSLDGANDPALYSAAIAYARKELVPKVARRGFETPTLEVHMQGDGTEDRIHDDGTVNVITVDPRSKSGRLLVGQFEWYKGHSVWGTSDEYCVHVVTEGDKTVLVLELLLSVIG